MVGGWCNATSAKRRAIASISFGQHSPRVALGLPCRGASISQAEHCVLARPLGRGITKSSDADAPRQPAFDSRLHKIGRQESQRYCHIDLTQAAVLSPSDAL